MSSPTEVEKLARQRAAEMGMSGSFRIQGFYLGYEAAYEDALAAVKRRKLTTVPGHVDNIWDTMLRRG